MSDNTKAVIDIIAEQAMLDRGVVTENTQLDTLNIDSVMMVEIIFAIEEHFGIHIPFNANTPEATEFDISTAHSIAKAVDALVSEAA